MLGVTTNHISPCISEPSTRASGTWIGRSIGSVFFQAEDGMRDIGVTGVQTCALPILVQSAGFGRGTRVGRVGTSSRHSLALTTEPGATADELLAFADKVVAAVQERFGVTLDRDRKSVV